MYNFVRQGWLQLEIHYVAVMMATILVLASFQSACAVEKKFWELSPYTIHIQIAVDDSARIHPTLGKSLIVYLKERMLATLHPLWSTELVLTAGPERHQLLNGLEKLEQTLPEERRFDKQMFLTVIAVLDGFTIACREWDKSTQLWGPVLQRKVRQHVMLHEQCFVLARETFAPLAMVRSDSENQQRVLLTFKGAELPRRIQEARFAQPGQVFMPLLIRFDHTGEVLPNGVSRVPWTYLTLEQPEDSQWKARVDSGIRRPFGIRRRGRSQHLAIALRHPPGMTRLRFYARHEESQGLNGYEVFRRIGDASKSESLGLTDATGSVNVAPVGSNLVTIFLRSDGQLLAKVPVPPGAKPIMEIPIADDTARLRAQAELSALRELLIDVVARRNILMARVRDRVDAGEIDEARQMLEELDDLPGRAQFGQMLSSAERKPINTSKDARVQARIEKMFAETRKLLGRFLDIRQINDLRTEVNTAARNATTSAVIPR